MLSHLGIGCHGDRATKLFSSHKHCCDGHWLLTSCYIKCCCISPWLFMSLKVCIFLILGKESYRLFHLLLRIVCIILVACCFHHIIFRTFWNISTSKGVKMHELTMFIYVLVLNDKKQINVKSSSKCWLWKPWFKSRINSHQLTVGSF